MKSLRLALRLAPAVALLLLAACGEPDKSYTGETIATHDCSKEPLLAINTTDGMLTFTSMCERITITGDGNNVKIEAASAVAINGARNTVEIGATDKISVAGSNNTVHYQKSLSGGLLAISTLGEKNTVSALPSLPPLGSSQ
jgi:Protein of unknown function (DUF3060)